MDNENEMIARLIDERNEARRMYCELVRSHQLRHFRMSLRAIADSTWPGTADELFPEDEVQP